jgi:hypothetical protein
MQALLKKQKPMQPVWSRGTNRCTCIYLVMGPSFEVAAQLGPYLGLSSSPPVAAARIGIPMTHPCHSDARKPGPAV